MKSDFQRSGRRTERSQTLTTEDGWLFIHGWTQVIAEVFHISIKGKILDELSEIAKNVQAQKK